MTGQVEAKGHEVAISLPPERLVVNGDPVRLTQVVSNLVGNAARYTPDGGKIKVSAVREGDHAVLRVRDNGPGISAELLPHVFELFVQGPGTLDRGRGGLGIGLTLVRSLVEMHGGAVSARSEGTEKGSEFIVRLPLLPAGEREVRTVPCAAAPGTGRSLRILVVEDNKDLARSFADLLSICGHEVRIAYDGPSGIDLASEYLPDAVFLDIGLPGMDGYEVARRLRQDERTARIPLFAMSGYGQAEDIRRSQEVGFTEHLLKPVGAERLLGLLDALPDR